jgi:sugar O-acyltransferase (sialic acid O-acetyltransferase NeuD family)
MTDIIIVGAGGFGREVAWTIDRINAASTSPLWRVIGFADDAAEKLPKAISGRPVLGTIAESLALYPDAAVFAALGDSAIRMTVHARLGDREFPSLVDPAAVVAHSATVGEGVFIGPLALVSTDAKICDFAVVNARAGVGHNSTVSSFATISPGVSLSGFTVVGEGATMGTNSSTLPGVKIGAKATVAAGTPAFSDLADGKTLSPFGMFRSGV